MFGFRILLFIVAYVVVLAEMMVGEGATESALQRAAWIIPGGLVIALLLAISNFMLANFDAAPDQRKLPTPIHWIIMLAAGALISASAFYFPNYISVWLKPMLL